jgi:hypothetical protein
MAHHRTAGDEHLREVEQSASRLLGLPTKHSPPAREDRLFEDLTLACHFAN